MTRDDAPMWQGMQQEERNWRIRKGKLYIKKNHSRTQRGMQKLYIVILMSLRLLS